MGAWGSNINEAHRDCEPDEGVRLDLPVGLMDLNGSTGITCTTATTPKRVLSSGQIYVQWDASSSVAAYIHTELPRNLALRPKSSGKVLYTDLRLSLRMKSAGATDSPAMTVTAKARSAGGAIKATFTAVFTPPPAPPTTSPDYTTYAARYATTNAVSGLAADAANPKNYVFSFADVAGTGPVYLAPGDSIDITITPGAHTTDAITLWDLRLSAGLNACNTERLERS